MITVLMNSRLKYKGLCLKHVRMILVMFLDFWDFGCVGSLFSCYVLLHVVVLCVALLVSCCRCVIVLFVVSSFQPAVSRGKQCNSKYTWISTTVIRECHTIIVTILIISMCMISSSSSSGIA